MVTGTQEAAEIDSLTNRMKPEAPKLILTLSPMIRNGAVGDFVQRVRQLGFAAESTQGTDLALVAIYGAIEEKNLNRLSTMPEVDQAIRPSSAYKLVGLDAQPGGSRVRLGDYEFGSERVGVIAGPCSVESLEQVMTVARRAKAAGAIALRGGAFKPRTSPYSFRGLEEEGLQMLADAREATGLPIVTEVMQPSDVELVASYADMLQVGARNMQNFQLLEAVGHTNRPVLLKRGMSATLDELLHSAEYIARAGNKAIVLCERGIRTFEEHTRNTLSLASIPYLKRMTHLPILADPSHGTGEASLVEPASLGAVAMGADGLIIEVHPNPAEALCDGPQSLTCEQFEQTMRKVAGVAAAVGRSV